MYQTIPVTLNKNQVMKLRNGGAVQLSASALQGGPHQLSLHPMTIKKIAKAIKNNRGVRISMSDDEFERSGEGLKEFFQSVGKKAKSVIQSPEYQKYVKPLVRKLVDQGLEMADPYLPDNLERYAKKGVNVVGKKTGAFGVREQVQKSKSAYTKYAKEFVAPHMKRGAKKVLERGVSKAKQSLPQYASQIDELSNKYGDVAVERLGSISGAYGIKNNGGRSEYRLQSNYSPLLGNQHPAMTPPNISIMAPDGGSILNYVLHSSRKLDRRNRKGGSFKLA